MNPSPSKSGTFMLEYVQKSSNINSRFVAPTKGKNDFTESLFNMHLRNRHGIFKDYIQKITTFVKELSTKNKLYLEETNMLLMAMILSVTS